MYNINALLEGIHNKDPRAIAKAISLVENDAAGTDQLLASLDKSRIAQSLVLGITGPPGVGKSTLTNQLLSKYRAASHRVGIIAIDPTSPITGGALLGDRIRMMQHATDPDVVMRSMATRGRLGGLCSSAGAVVRIMASSGCSPIIIETVGVGQLEMDIIRLADITTLVLAPGLGDDIQAMKAGLQEVADLFVVNKADRPGADVLFLDLQNIATSNADNQPLVCMTTATDGTGVENVVSLVSSLDRQHRHSGEREQRRQKADQFEILDWALELLRPQIFEKIQTSDSDTLGDPKAKAKKILKDL